MFAYPPASLGARSVHLSVDAALTSLAPNSSSSCRTAGNPRRQFPDWAAKEAFRIHRQYLRVMVGPMGIKSKRAQPPLDRNDPSTRGLIYGRSPRKPSFYCGTSAKGTQESVRDANRLNGGRASNQAIGAE